MTTFPFTGAAAGILCLGALVLLPAASASPLRIEAAPLVCSAETQHAALVSRRGEPASERVLQLVEGNLALFAVNLSRNVPLSAEVAEQQMVLMRSVASELGFAHDAPTEVTGD
ncbi:hypothetical protein [Phreatobacter sp.]|uniref:hypothetical protein n=1 Tax=Phreatobacter sp. TaxID=1966341 RepID=UPI0022C5BEB9|nr:hypothetical protein [Phreatobacter sp.]MCZ8313983.1 hypothetical protein [Phreatobacter sp.]